MAAGVQDGLERVDERLEAEDFRMAFYGDVYRPVPIEEPRGTGLTESA